MTTLHEAVQQAIKALDGATRQMLNTPQRADCYSSMEELRSALSQQGEQQPVAKYIGECHDGSLVQLYEDLKKGTELYAGASPAPQAQREPDWSNSETGINELWKNPAHSMADRLRMADGAVAFRDKTIANLRHQLKQQSE